MTSYSFRANPPPRPFQNGRFHFIRGVVLFLFAMLAVRLVYVQAVLRTDLQKKANRQISFEPNPRGVRANILDRKGRVIAETVQVTSCYADPSKIKDKLGTARRLADSLGLNPMVLLKTLKSTKGSFVWVKRNLPADELEKLKSQKLTGIGFKLEWRRNYPLSPIAPHLVGLVGIDGK